MTQNFAVYAPDTGRIRQIVQCDKEHMLCGGDERYTEVPELVDPSLWYISNKKMVLRPTLAVSLGTQVLRGVPIGAAVTIEGQTYTADGTDIELEFSLPGSYLIRVSCWPYLDWEGSYEN